jgi:exopolysaccharide production protein ExoY
MSFALVQARQLSMLNGNMKMSRYSDFASKTNAVAVPNIKEFSRGRPGFYRNIAKRIIDIVLVLIALPIVLPIVLVLMAFVVSDGNKPFYSQKRVGQNGRIFTMWKLRTMVPDADRLLETYLAANPAARLEWNINQKLRHDPRITRVGRMMRAASIDELPQLWNVLRGDMSLVGPRPMLPEQQDMYPGKAYYAVRPGITGSWQVSDRNRSSFAARAEFDTEYDSKLSMWMDLGILLATVRVVIDRTGL